MELADQADQWEHRMAVVNGINIHYVIEGQGAPVVFIHGWPEFWYGWRRQIPVLSERYQVIVPDLRGFGYSDKPLHGYDTKSAASDIYELVRQLGHQKVSIVAHDIGVHTIRIATHCTEADVAEQHISSARKLEMDTVGFLMMAHMIEAEQLLEQALLMESYGANCWRSCA